MNITREQRKQIWNHRYGYIQTGSSFTINGCCRDITGAGKHAIHGSIINNPNIDKCADLFGRKLTEDQKRTIITLDAAIGNNKTEFPMLVIRNVDNNAIKALFKGIDMMAATYLKFATKSRKARHQPLLQTAATFQFQQTQQRTSSKKDASNYNSKYQREHRCTLQKTTRRASAFLDEKQSSHLFQQKLKREAVKTTELLDAELFIAKK